MPDFDRLEPNTIHFFSVIARSAAAGGRPILDKEVVTASVAKQSRMSRPLLDRFVAALLAMTDIM
jgi:hypothetical protein